MTETDPFLILGIEPSASEEEIRAAYLGLIQQHPPERDAEGFERIRDAYADLRDPRERTRRRLFSGASIRPMTDLLDGHEPRRSFTGPKAWLAVLKEK